MNGDLISRSAMLEQVRFTLPSDSERRKVIADCVETFRRLINDAPAVDAVELVRCKDCYYWLKAKVNRSGNLVCPKSGMEIVATDFCSKSDKRRCKYEK